MTNQKRWRPLCHSLLNYPHDADSSSQFLAMIGFSALSSSRGISVRIRPVAIISLILIICIYLVLPEDPAYQVDREGTDRETTTQENSPSDSSSASIQVTAERKRELAGSPRAGIDSSTTATDSNATDVIIIGNYADPDDSSPLDREGREPINIGVVLDADNDQSSPTRDNVPPISKGDFIDVNALGYANSAEGKESISLGQPLDVESLLAGEYGDPSNQARTPISIGGKIEVPE